MPRETAGGRVARTIYLPQELWDELEAVSNGRDKHPAKGHFVRSGSLSSLIEAIVRNSRPTHEKLAHCLEVIRELQDQAAQYRQLGPWAIARANEFRVMANEVEVQLRTIAKMAHSDGTLPAGRAAGQA